MTEAEAKYKDWFLNQALRMGLASLDSDWRIILADMTLKDTEGFMSLSAARNCGVELSVADEERCNELDERYRNASRQRADAMDEALGKPKH